MRQLIYIFIGVYALIVWRVYAAAERAIKQERARRRGKLAQRLEAGQ